mmetsp:Transcript_14367/g.21705  ORF Transcript_14367/g.21705 Transcript_14367/m.21705 type:complete len:218 (+) Transcript_14367:365-1018(+)|eukprot:CAMPEP_0202710156 /NCGR_PEP_ID=MMETSP1385-20130828/22169_1 /ASSEMBLY_ACC=CAM_ASM_000861 /TAXON_ID=933848 /ORGANISM="Elphidium margaritaceum" /LENGTH=217 /DNA_ID=CAMNT_0049369607 /DNA_START=365 /DNA_END=1018 /DNA_ORIENTATION=+
MASTKTEQKNDDDMKEKEQAAANLLWTLYQKSPLKFRNNIQNMLAKRNVSQDIMKWGDQSGNDSADIWITKDEFVQYLDGKLAHVLAEVVFAMIYAARDADKKESEKEKKISRVNVLKFVEGHKSKKHVRMVTAQDANWVLSTIQKTNFADIAKDAEFKIDFAKFEEYFKPVGISQERIRSIFDEIDHKKQGYITVVAYTKWRSHQKADDLLLTLNK